MRPTPPTSAVRPAALRSDHVDEPHTAPSAAGMAPTSRCPSSPLPYVETDVDVGDTLRPLHRDVEPDDVTMWEALVAEVTAPAALARVKNRLFRRRAGNAGIPPAGRTEA